MAVSRQTDTPVEAGRLLSLTGPARSRERVVAALEREALRRNLRAVEEVRARWARELHDDTLQGLGALRMMLRDAQGRDDVESIREGVEHVVERLGQEITNLRSLIADLRPAALDQLGLATALEGLFERTRDIHRIRINASVVLGESLDPEIETAVYRVVQESLTNAVRHSRADCVEIDVLDAGEEILIAVRDDGQGFDVFAPSPGFGLCGMRERIALAGGVLEIVSSASGTRVSAVVPASRTASGSA